MQDLEDLLVTEEIVANLEVQDLLDPQEQLESLVLVEFVVNEDKLVKLDLLGNKGLEVCQDLEDKEDLKEKLGHLGNLDLQVLQALPEILVPKDLLDLLALKEALDTKDNVAHQGKGVNQDHLAQQEAQDAVDLLGSVVSMGPLVRLGLQEREDHKADRELEVRI